LNTFPLLTTQNSGEKKKLVPIILLAIADKFMTINPGG